MGPDDVEVVEKTTPFSNYFRVDQYLLKHRLFQGGWSKLLSREVFERGHAVNGLLYDPELDRLVFIEQFRQGAFAALASPWFEDNGSPWLIEVIAGIIDEGETPEAVLYREAIEEAGCTILEHELICHYLVSPGGSSESMFSFCGRVDSSNVGGVYGLEEEGEDIRVFTLSFEEAMKMLDQGKVLNSMTIIPMQWFRLNRDRLRTKWLHTPDNA